jgi:hypothetical protein
MLDKMLAVFASASTCTALHFYLLRVWNSLDLNLLATDGLTIAHHVKLPTAAFRIQYSSTYRHKFLKVSHLLLSPLYFIYLELVLLETGDEIFCVIFQYNHVLDRVALNTRTVE